MNNRAKVYAAVVTFRTKLINFILEEDIVKLSVYSYGIDHRTCFDIFKHAEAQNAVWFHTHRSKIACPLLLEERRLHLLREQGLLWGGDMRR